MAEAMEGKLDNLCLVKDCRELEEAFGLKLTDSILSEEGWGPVMKGRLIENSTCYGVKKRPH